MFERFRSDREDLWQIAQPINSNPEGKNLLSIMQLSPDDIEDYISAFLIAKDLVSFPRRSNVLAGYELKTILQDPSSVVAGSCATAMHKLGGTSDLLISGNTQARDESLTYRWEAAATQADILAIRSNEDFVPHSVAERIHELYLAKKLSRFVPVINLGDGENEQPIQALADMATIYKRYNRFSGLSAAVVGDTERDKAQHSFIMAAVMMGIEIHAIESEVSKVPSYLKNMSGSRLVLENDFNYTLQNSDIIYMGANKDHKNEHVRQASKTKSDEPWRLDYRRLQKAKSTAIVMHPGPIGQELDDSVQLDNRCVYFQQMENLVPMKMAVLASHLGINLRKLYPQNGL